MVCRHTDLKSESPAQAGAGADRRCPAPKYINQTAKAIYKLEGKTLTIAAHEPGDEAVPTTFEPSVGNRMRAFVFTRQ